MVVVRPMGPRSGLVFGIKIPEATLSIDAQEETTDSPKANGTVDARRKKEPEVVAAVSARRATRCLNVQL